jgi:hypothetical protein
MVGDGILGHQFNKRLESFVPCSSQSHLLANFKEKHVHEEHFLERENKAGLRILLD